MPEMLQPRRFCSHQKQRKPHLLKNRSRVIPRMNIIGATHGKHSPITRRSIVANTVKCSQAQTLVAMYVVFQAFTSHSRLMTHDPDSRKCNPRGCLISLVFPITNSIFYLRAGMRSQIIQMGETIGTYVVKYLKYYAANSGASTIAGCRS